MAGQFLPAGWEDNRCVRSRRSGFFIHAGPPVPPYRGIYSVLEIVSGSLVGDAPRDDNLKKPCHGEKALADEAISRAARLFWIAATCRRSESAILTAQSTTAATTPEQVCGTRSAACDGTCKGGCQAQKRDSLGWHQARAFLLRFFCLPRASVSSIRLWMQKGAGEEVLLAGDDEQRVDDGRFRCKDRPEGRPLLGLR